MRVELGMRVGVGLETRVERSCVNVVLGVNFCGEIG